MKNIRYGSDENKDEIISLWNICFPEAPEFSEWYFKNVFSPKNTLIYEENDKITAMLQEIPLNFNNSGKATYIYGACTHPLYRKKGLMTKLLRQSFKNDTLKGITHSILIPENEELFRFYKQFGYNKTTLVKKEVFKSSDFTQNSDNKYILKKADFSDIENMNSLYKKVLCDNDFIFRDTSFWEKQIQMFSNLNGDCFCLYNAKDLNLEAYAFLWPEKVLQAQEMCFTDNTAKSILCKNLFAKSGAEELEINYYDKKGDYRACIKFHNSDKENNIYFSDYIINLLWN